MPSLVAFVISDPHAQDPCPCKYAECTLHKKPVTATFFAQDASARLTCFHDGVPGDACLEVCGPTPFTLPKNFKQGKCPAFFNIEENIEHRIVCADGAEHCAKATKVNITIETKVPAAPSVVPLVEDETPKQTDCTVAKDPAHCCNLQFNPPSKCWNTKGCRWSRYGCVLGPPPSPPAPQPVCFHEEDAEDHKCFEACGMVPQGKTFRVKGIETAGLCPSNYNTVDATKTVLQCPDGVTNVKYCAATALNVTVMTMGEDGGAATTAAVDDECGRRHGTFCVGPPIPFLNLNRTLLHCPSGKRQQCESGNYCENSGTGAPVNESVCQVL